MFGVALVDCIDFAVTEAHLQGAEHIALRTAPIPIIIKITLALLVQLLIHGF